MREFIVIEQTALYGAHTNYQFVIHYGWDGGRFPTWKQARRHGFQSRGSDDFNIAILEGDTLVEFLWMNQCMDDPEGMRAIADEHDFKLPKDYRRRFAPSKRAKQLESA